MQRTTSTGQLVNFSVPCNYKNLVPTGVTYENGPFPALTLERDRILGVSEEWKDAQEG